MTFVDLGLLQPATERLDTHPELLGDPTPHDVHAYYLGWNGDGHIGRLNITNSFYDVLVTDQFNGLAGRKVQINAQQAAAELAALRHAVGLSPNEVAPHGIAYLFAAGFLPGHPVQLLIDNHVVVTLTASVLGTVTYMIDPTTLHLVPGTHEVMLKSMILKVTSSFRSH